MAFHPKHPPALTSAAGYVLAGGTSGRPKHLGEVEAGVEYFDQDLGKPVWWTGEKWVLADGSDADPAGEAPAPVPVKPIAPQPDQSPSATVSP